MKYMGSKARIVNDILPLMLDDNYTDFIDVFCGSCSVIQKVPKHYKRIANDVNKFLIGMWDYLVYNVMEFPRQIPREKYNHFRELYKNRKKNDNNEIYGEDAMCGWIGFMGSFNGRFYDGGYSGHDVNGRDYITENINNTLSQVEDLKGVEFINYDYKNIPINNKSIIYCDPPYKGVKKYSYSINHDDFWNWCREQTAKGNKVFISEYNAPDDFVCIWQKQITNAMNLTKTTKPVEKLFVHKSQIK